MKLEDMILVSVDDHVCEPPDMWTSTCRRAGRSALLGWSTSRTVWDVWAFEGQQIPTSTSMPSRVALRTSTA